MEIPDNAYVFVLEDHYIPLPRQAAFHESEAKLRAYIGGFGSGKTLSGCWEALILSLEYPGNVGAICRETYQELKDTTQKTFFEICPEELIESFNKSDNHLVFKNGSEIYFRSLDRFDIKFRSLNLGWFYFDEASHSKEEALLFLIGRLRLPVARRCGYITSNPPFEGHWIHKRFVEEDRSGHDFFKAPTSENFHLPEDYVQFLEENYDEKWKKVFIKGDFGFIADGEPVYPEFSESIHVKKVEYTTGVEIIRSWDFGFHHPACVVAQKIGNELNVLAEFQGENELIKDFGAKVLRACNENYPKAEFRDCGDPAGKQKSDKSKKTSFQILASLGVFVQSRQFGINNGLTICRMLIHPNKGKAKLHIDKSCKLLIRALSGGYCYGKNKDIPDDQKMPVKDNIHDHLPDCLRYMVINQPDFRRWLDIPKIKVAPRYNQTFREAMRDMNKKNSNSGMRY